MSTWRVDYEYAEAGALVFAHCLVSADTASQAAQIGAQWGTVLDEPVIATFTDTIRLVARGATVGIEQDVKDRIAHRLGHEEPMWSVSQVQRLARELAREVCGPAYAMFSEYNDEEDETWYRFIPVLGNAEQIERLARAVKDIDGGRTFEVADTVVYQIEVDALTAHADGTSYLHEYQVLPGRLTLPSEDVLGDPDALFDVLYKGRIERLMVDDPEPVQ